jgi:class 3 adenylate cyclase
MRGRDADDLRRYLPPILRALPISRFLLPPANVPEAERGLYPIRMTLAILGAIVFAAQSLLFAFLSLWWFAASAALGMTIVVVGGAWLRRRAVPSMLMGWAAVFAQLAAIQIFFGPAVGAFAFGFPIAVAAFSVYRPDEWLSRLLPTLFAILLWGVTVVSFEPAPLIHLLRWEEQLLFAFHTGGALYGVFVLASHAAIFRLAAEQQIASERDRADGLLLNILPAPIAARLMETPGTIADSFAEVTVLFADLVGFTQLAGQLSSSQVVELLNELFSRFDELAERNGLEKIKTIGDAYMVVGGAPEQRVDHARRATRMALEMQSVVEAYAETSGRPLALRIGLHTGPVTAGVIGKKKFSYDLWGDTVNVASRMESHGEPGRVQVSAEVRARLGAEFSFEGPRRIEVKGKGAMEVWFVREP